jgi:hypothetical protein
VDNFVYLFLFFFAFSTKNKENADEEKGFESSGFKSSRGGITSESHRAL